MGKVETVWDFCGIFASIQQGCRLYLEKIGRKVANLAHGRDPDDFQILKENSEQMAQEMERFLEEQEGFQEDLNELILTLIKREPRKANNYRNN